MSGGQPHDPATAGDTRSADEPSEVLSTNGEQQPAGEPSPGDPDDEFGAPSEQSAFPADLDDPDLNPDVERASEIDDVTGPVPVVSDDAEPEAITSDADGGNAVAANERRGQSVATESTERDTAEAGVDGDGAPAPETEAAQTDELDAVRAERDEYRTMAQRIQADFDNFRKRSIAQAAAEADRAAGRLIEALLPVLDAAEAAYIEHPDEVGPLLNAMLGELRRHGLETVELEGQPFDPEVAEAVAHEPGDGGDVVIAEVLRSGYRWKDKTLRPAMVRTKD